jgi:hypothetical protein
LEKDGESNPKYLLRSLGAPFGVDTRLRSGLTAIKPKTISITASTLSHCAGSAARLVRMIAIPDDIEIRKGYG